ncbi:hypothetical protein EK904_013146 [Melospiza melodia maxima]|nr:hypothetical protein EK904_013146 [Melospiza melodia maxima]
MRNFNRCITSQLIKWFSNFREFYYIQMEKYARQAINDGVTSTEELSITRDCELYRALNMHYNKANDFEASLVAQQTIVIINMLTLGDTTGECFSLLRMAVCIVQVKVLLYSGGTPAGRKKVAVLVNESHKFTVTLRILTPLCTVPIPSPGGHLTAQP